MRKYKGIDVSKYQGVVNWKQVKQDGIAFAVLRAGYGKYVSQKDSMFEQNDKACRALKMPLGIYWYSYATTTEEAEQEANACLAVLKKRSYPLAVWYDVEDKTQMSLSRETVTAIVERFCETVKKAGYTAGIYSYQSFLESHLTKAVREKFPVWVAHTGVTETSYSMPYRMWQYSHTGRVSGVSGDVDMNYLYGELPKDASKEKPASAPVVTSEEIIYTVKKGDTLSELAQKYDSTVQKIAVDNDIVDPNRIYIGQKLKIYTNSDNQASKIYVVKKGDTLTKIAAAYQTTVSELVQKNNIADADLIYEGQQLKI